VLSTFHEPAAVAAITPSVDSGLSGWGEQSPPQRRVRRPWPRSKASSTTPACRR